MSHMRVTFTEDGTILLFDSEVGTVSANSVDAAWDKIRRRKADKHAREFLKARDMILTSSVGFQ